MKAPEAQALIALIDAQPQAFLEACGGDEELVQSTVDALAELAGEEVEAESEEEAE